MKALQHPLAHSWASLVVTSKHKPPHWGVSVRTCDDRWLNSFTYTGDDAEAKARARLADAWEAEARELMERAQAIANAAKELREGAWQ